MEIDRGTSNVLRGIAIILIVLWHAVRGFSIPFSPMEPGQIGVWMFLFLSGYGICRSYGLSNIDARKYLVKRFRRVVIPYWTVLTAVIAALLFFMPSYFSSKSAQLAIPLNYLLMVFSPYDIVVVGWFVTYIVMWYLVYLGVSKLPLRDELKMGLMLFGIPALVYFGGGNFIDLIRMLMPDAQSGLLYGSRTLYLPYALAFPLGVLASRRGSWQIHFSFPALQKVGEYAYWIYLLHFGLLCGLFVFGNTDYCREWTNVEVDRYLTDAYVNMVNGNYSAVISLSDKAIALNRYSAAAYVIRGSARVKLGDYAGAMGDYDKAIEADPWQLMAYANRGNLKSDMGNYSGAIADYDKAIELKPEVAEFYVVRGISQGRRGNYTGANTDLDVAIGLNHDYAIAYYNRGGTKLMLGDYAGAKADLDKAHALDPALPDYEAVKAQMAKTQT
ncbi:MAG: acyltransferase family protein [Candidatus Burarchaeum sp.]|nr:acyltransferase family protein [Candidatus Burarchaeum sp.]MDO8339213.1 acyltransferase family protein [Candidatus Burarchaeum sp.]